MAADVTVGSTPHRADRIDAVEREVVRSGGGTGHAPRSTKAGTCIDPLDELLWGMNMIKAPQAHARELVDRRVTELRRPGRRVVTMRRHGDDLRWW